MDVQNQPGGLPSSPSLPPSANRSGSFLAVVSVVAACAHSAGGAYWMTRDSVPNGQASSNSLPQDDTPPHADAVISPINSAQMFAGWDNPDFVLCLTGQTHGYLQPCGCSDPQYGGLARRWQFFK